MPSKILIVLNILIVSNILTVPNILIAPNILTVLNILIAPNILTVPNILVISNILTVLHNYDKSDVDIFFNLLDFKMLGWTKTFYRKRGKADSLSVGQNQTLFFC